MDLWFLPAWPPPVNNAIIFGLLLIAGLGAGRLATRTRYIPGITGYIVIGFLLGPSVSGVLGAPLLEQSQIFVDIALGLIFFQVGLLLDLRAFRNERGLLATGLIEAGLSFGAIYTALALLGMETSLAGLIAAIGISSSPAVLLLVTRELGAHGDVTRRALYLVALNNVLAFLAYTLLLPVLHYSQAADWTTVILHPLYRLAGALGLGYALAVLTLRLGRFLGKSERVQFPLLVAIIVLGVGLAQMLQVSELLTLLALGMVTRNLDQRDDIAEVKFGHAGDIFFIILFVVAGAKLHLDYLAVAGPAALAFVLARCAGKSFGSFVASRAAGLDKRQSAMLGLTLVPMAGMAIGLSQATVAMYPEIGARLAAVVLAAVAILETIGPIVTEYALKRAGEVAADRRVEH